MLMKFLNKTAVKRILLIVLCALVILPFILDLMKVDVKEGFSDTPKAASEYESNGIKMNRIITAKGANFDATNGSMTDADVSYTYCISAQDTDIKCKTGILDVSYTDLSFSYGDGLIGTTYDASCHLSDGTNVVGPSFECVTIGNGLPASLYGLELNTETSQYGVSGDMVLELNDLFDNDASYSGFTQNMTSMPLQFDESGDLNMFYSGNSEYVKTLKCFLFDTSGNCETALQSAYPSDEETDKEEGDKDEGDEAADSKENKEKCDSVNIKCLAHFGTKVGDPLCCGQTGVLQNTNHVCPQELPTCAGYQCGSQWGVCTK